MVDVKFGAGVNASDTQSDLTCVNPFTSLVGFAAASTPPLIAGHVKEAHT